MLKPRRFKDDLINKPSAGVNIHTIYSNWVLFLCSVITCLFIGITYLNFSKPLYQVSITIPVKSTSKFNQAGKAQKDSASSYNSNSNYLLQQVERLQSKQLFEKAVKNLGLCTSYFKHSTFSDAELYGTGSPIKLRIKKNSIISKKQFTVIVSDSNQFRLQYGSVNELHKFGDHIIRPDYEFTVNKTPAFTNAVQPIVVKISDLNSIIEKLSGSTDLRQSLKDSNSIVITLTDPIPQRGKDLLTEMNKLYINSDVNAKVAYAAITFINKQLDTLNRDLMRYKSEIASHSNPVLIKKPLTLNPKRSDTNQANLEKQFAILQAIASYVNIPENQFTIIPNTFDIADRDLLILINRLNETQITKQELLEDEDENDQELTHINERLSILRQSAIHEIFNERSRLYRLLNNTDKKLVSNPQSHLVNINNSTLEQLRTEQQAKVRLYFYLMEKREGIKTSLPNTTAHKPHITVVPIKENSIFVLFVALFAGLAIPFLYFFLQQNIKTTK